MKKSEELLLNYYAIKELINLINNRKIVLTNLEKRIFKFINFELCMLTRMLKIHPYYFEMPFINFFIKILLNKNPNIKDKIDSGFEQFNKQIREEIETLRKKSLISCFSKRNDSILMWSHYADSHRGICLEIEYSEVENFRDVSYTDRRSNIKIYNLISFLLANEFIGSQRDISKYKNQKKLLTPFFVKSKEWSYEKEVRCLFLRNKIDSKNIDYDGENYFLSNGKIKRIYVGSKAAGVKVDRLLEYARNRGIAVDFMKESEEEYKIITDSKHEHQKSNYIKETRISILRIIEEIQKALNNEIYIAAFALALNIPAICGAKEYPSSSEEEQYCMWAQEMYSKFEKCPCDSCIETAYPSSKFLFELRQKFIRNGTFNLDGDFDEFYLDKFILRIEEKKPLDIYVGGVETKSCSDGRQHSILTINVRDFCLKMMKLASNYYYEKSHLFNEEDCFEIENYDKIIDEFNEMLVLKERLDN